MRLAGAKGSQVTFQYHQTHVSEQDAPWLRLKLINYIYMKKNFQEKL